MLTRRVVSALALALPLALAACDDRSIHDKGDTAADSMGEATDTTTDGTDTTTDDTTGEPLPPSHDGESCEGHIGASQPCSSESEVGLEFCAFDPMSYQYLWSACFLETCDSKGATQACDADGVEGSQICVAAGEALVWGLCVTAPECVPGEKQDCGLEFPKIDMSCRVSDEGVPYWGYEDCNTPLVLSFDGRAPAFSAPPASAAAFDINGAGACVSTEWPSAATPWLALDRDRNGTIDGGHELFGNGTRVAAGGHATHGFDALADLDSDRDGRITGSDERFAELVLWSDHDGDRRSSGWELLPLAAYGVEAIELDYRDARECDARGNCSGERASFTFRDGGRTRSGEVIDVYLACAE
ncbi:MAG: calcium-binding protein [Nannocystaceae bacterium]